MASTTRITVTAEATVDSPAERAVIRFRRGNLYDKQLDRPTMTGTELCRLVIEAGAEDIKVIPSKGKVIIRISDLSTLGSVLANLRNLGPVKRPNTAFEVSDETHELLVAEAVSYAIEQARADVEPTVRLLRAGSVRVVNVEVKKAKAVAGTWKQLSSRALNASAWVRVEVTFELIDTDTITITDELHQFYDQAGNPDLAPIDTDEDENDPFGGAVFGVEQPSTSVGLAESVGVPYKHAENASGNSRAVSLDDI